MHSEVHGRRGDERRERKHDERGDHRLDPARGDLLHRHRPDRHRCQHAVLDLAGVSEVLHEWERHRLYALEDHRTRDHAADEQGRESGSVAASSDRLTDLREHVREDEDEQERLHDRATQEHRDLLAENSQVAKQQCEERVPRRRARGTNRDRAHSRSSLPVRPMNTVSSVVSVMPRSCTSNPACSARVMSWGSVAPPAFA